MTGDQLNLFLYNTGHRRGLAQQGHAGGCNPASLALPRWR